MIIPLDNNWLIDHDSSRVMVRNSQVESFIGERWNFIEYYIPDKGIDNYTLNGNQGSITKERIPERYWYLFETIPQNILERFFLYCKSL